MKIKVDIFKCFDGKSKDGKEYHIAQVRIPAGAGEVGTVFSDISLNAQDACDVELIFSTNKQQNLVPRIKAVV
jgi:hypothetical protein